MAACGASRRRRGSLIDDDDVDEDAMNADDAAVDSIVVPPLHSLRFDELPSVAALRRQRQQLEAATRDLLRCVTLPSVSPLSTLRSID